ncbi:hypothetical protein GUITHDRAFT_65097, partial [Guillardia theta CCMP2712]
MNKTIGVYSTEIRANKADASKTWVERYDIFTAGKQTTFRIEALDKYSNRLTKGGDNFQVKLLGSYGRNYDGSIRDLGNGSYFASFNVSVTGNFSLFLTLGLETGLALDNFDGTYTLTVPAVPTVGQHWLEVTRGGAHILGSPYAVMIYPGSINLYTSTINLDSLKQLNVGDSASFLIKSKDQFNNLLTLGGEVFAASTSSPAQRSFTVVDTNNGEYIGAFMTTIAGSYSLRVTLN